MAKVSRADQYMPEEVITQILSWTKATSLLSCKSVCKSWRSIISQPKFTAAHHPNSLIHPSLLLITSETGYGPDKLDDRLAATIVYSDCSKFNLPLPHFFEAKRFIGSCNGFVCVSDAIGDVIYLSNPVIRTCKQLPRVCLGDAYNREEAPFKVDVVFGFDYVSGGSKVLRIKYRKEGGDSKRVRVSVVELYSSNADSWREIEAGCVMLRNVGEIFDPVVRDGGPKIVMERFVHIGLLCAHVMVTLRPTIADALKMLGSDIDIPELPERPLPLGHESFRSS
ncbi:hypothetical protein DCAR_0103787 [Daucus carota subsp. sativus]|uniref:F-box domain-containing protein n=1 Tax=Daucus carota subsp. sativus TaxID=79200 RepID=A0A166IA91_DAUCS|nr:hypothetical protein DCAR_0103787 [Daucus carota subsp. sativus]